MLYFVCTFLDKYIRAEAGPQTISTRSKTAWNRETDKRITKLIRSTFETGAVCSAVAFLDLAIYLRDGQNTVHISMFAYLYLGQVPLLLILLRSQTDGVIQVIQQCPHRVAQFTGSYKWVVYYVRLARRGPLNIGSLQHGPVHIYWCPCDNG